MENNKAIVQKKYPGAHCMLWASIRVGEIKHFRIYTHALSDSTAIGGGPTEELAWANAAAQIKYLSR